MDSKVDPTSTSASSNPRAGDGTTDPDCAEFCVVGVGASAGGLEALEQFFDAMPSDPGMAFVVVQHLSPDFKSHMEQLLARHTGMAIHRVENGMEVEAGAIYLIPPRMEMVISNRRLLLTAKAERTLSHPIDQFLRSLASDQGRYAVGVILSGTGSDGSRGIREIADAGGLALAQDAESAKFDGMPLNAVATGAVHSVLPPAGLADVIVRYVRDGLSPKTIAEQDLSANTLHGLERVFQLLDQQHGLDFSHYKSSTVGRRIQRRIDLMGMNSLNEYLESLENNPIELNDLYKDLLIGVTRFFRDSDAFDLLQRSVVPELIANQPSGRALRVWVPGCATGEEAYSIAILIDEELQRRGRRLDVKVFATDVHHVSLAHAARGAYPEEALESMDGKRRARYFRKRRDGYHVSRELRRYVVFAPHNVISDAPFTQIDLVSCRNLLIYLQPNAQRKALAMFHFALRSSGVLFLGPSETPGEFSDEFQPLDSKWRLYRKVRDVRLPLDSRLRLDAAPRRPYRPQKGAERAGGVDKQLIETYDRLLDRSMPPSILVDEDGQLLHTFGGAERFLRPRGGRPSNDLHDLVVDSLRPQVAGALQHALRKGSAVRYSGGRFADGDREEDVTVVVEPIPASRGGSTSILVEFQVATSPALSAEIEEVDLRAHDAHQIASLESELRYARENLQATIEEMETSNEELQATNEELTASNEELQSTNEELHSVNEELYTVNAEHQRRLDELAQANDDMDNLLATTRVGVLFLDDELLIRRYTPEMASMFHLVEHDLGRSIEGFTHNLAYGELVADLHYVLENQAEKEATVRDRTGKWLLVRMLPYRSGGDINGVVLTLIDIDSQHRATTELARFRFAVDSVADLTFLLDDAGVIVYANTSATERLGYSREVLCKRSLADLDPTHTPQTYRELLSETADGASPRMPARFLASDGSRVSADASVGRFASEGRDFFVVAARDTTQEEAMSSRMSELGQLVNSSPDAISIRNSKGVILTWSGGAEEVYGIPEDRAVGRTWREVLPVDAAALDQAHGALESEGSWAGEWTFALADGSERIVSSHQKTVTTPVGWQRTLQIDRDISDARRTLNELEEANAAAVKANRAKTTFLTKMSHELRTPLAAMLGFADILRGESGDPLVRERVGVIEKNGTYLLALLDDLLDLSRVEADQLKLTEELVDMAKLAQEVFALMKVRADEKHLPLTLELDASRPCFVVGDRVRLRQVLVNLTSNAIKFTSAGSVAITVRSDEPGAGAHIYVDVQDTGIGIEASGIQRLFTPFSQLADAAGPPQSGSGLGLSISKALAEGMGGSLTVQSEKGQGSCFTLAMPLALVKEKRRNADKQAQSSTALPHLDARLLVVDDQPDVAQVLRFYLERAGATVEIARDGEEALEKWEAARASEAGPYDLILMDMQMPKLNGQDTIVELQRRRARVPIVAVTAHAMEQERIACRKLGCAGYVTKPVDAETLVSLVAAAIKTSMPPEDNEDNEDEEDRGDHDRQDSGNGDPGASSARAASGGANGRPRLRILVAEDDEDLAELMDVLLTARGFEVVLAATVTAAMEAARTTPVDGVIVDVNLGDRQGSELLEPLRAGGFAGPIAASSASSAPETRVAALEAGFDTYFRKPVNADEVCAWFSARVATDG